MEQAALGKATFKLIQEAVGPLQQRIQELEQQIESLQAMVDPSRAASIFDRAGQ
jgi:tetrahydromethanopterin S-methyltransferase subunit B